MTPTTCQNLFYIYPIEKDADFIWNSITKECVCRSDIGADYGELCKGCNKLIQEDIDTFYNSLDCSHHREHCDNCK